MPTMQELLGTTDVDPQAAIAHLEWLFKPDDIVHISALRQKRKAKNYHSVISLGGTCDEMCRTLNDEGLDWVKDGDPENPWNVYYSIAPASEVIEGVGKRPSKKQACGIRLLFGDLDVKPGGFSSSAEIAEFVGDLSITPGSIVWTGSGGAHVTWKIADDSLDSMWAEDKVGERWWSYLDSEASRLGYEVSIDRLIDSESRVLRLPGTVRWPKANLDKPHSVIGYRLDYPDLTTEQFLQAVEEPYKKYEARVTKRRTEDISLRDSMVGIADPSSKWSRTMLYAMIDEYCETSLTWSEMLEPAGWTKLRDGGDGSTEWTRPGGDGKSATTDWPDSPEIMSLFSTDESTELNDLYEAEIPLTKWRVFLRIIHGDDVDAALDDLGRRVKQAGSLTTAP